MKIEELKKIADAWRMYKDYPFYFVDYPEVNDMVHHFRELLAVVEAAKEMQGEALINGCWYTFLPCEYAENVDIALKKLEEK